MSLFTTTQRKHTDVGDVDFAARELRLDRAIDEAYLRSIVASGQRRGRRAWKWAEAIGEVSYAISRNARIAGYAEVAVYEVDANGVMKKCSQRSQPGRIGSQLYSPTGGQRGLIERYFHHIKVPGETILVRQWNGDVPDGYDFCSTDELEPLDPTASGGKGGWRRRILPMGAGDDDEAAWQQIKPEDILGRIWRPSGRYVHMPDSPLVALDDVCEILHYLTRSLKGKLRQRLAMNPILYIPQEINKIRTAAPKGNREKFHDNEVINELMNAGLIATGDESSPVSALPNMLVGPGDQAKNLLYVDRDLTVLETEIKLRAELLDRILFGLDINPEGVKGASEASHWGAWAATDDERRIAVQPDLETLCWAATRLILWPALLAAGKTGSAVTKYVFWYDLSRATAKTNLAEDARQTYDRGELSGADLRRLTGIPDDCAPTEVERVRQFGWETGDPYLAFFGQDIAKDIDLDKVTARRGPKADGTGDRPQSGPGKGDPGSPNPKDRRSDTPRTERPA